jgi:hypothetical protein
MSNRWFCIVLLVVRTKLRTARPMKALFNIGGGDRWCWHLARARHGHAVEKQPPLPRRHSLPVLVVSHRLGEQRDEDDDVGGVGVWANCALGDSPKNRATTVVSYAPDRAAS